MTFSRETLRFWGNSFVGYGAFFLVAFNLFRMSGRGPGAPGNELGLLTAFVVHIGHIVLGYVLLKMSQEQPN